MTDSKRPLSSLVIRNLMLEALGYKENDLGLDDDNFKKYRYSGSQRNLYTITELLAIKHGLIEKTVEIPIIAWGAEGRKLYPQSNTNFMPQEIQGLFEGFWLLLNQNIIAPGAFGESENLPYFHVTPHGLTCLDTKEILPYDIDGYLKKIYSINQIDEWVKSYMTEAVRCFNSNCHHAATIMIGLSAEKLTLNLIDAFKTYLQKHQANLKIKQNAGINIPLDLNFSTKVDSTWMISQKYQVFQTFYDAIINHPKDVKSCIDTSSRNVFSEYIRLTRNEVSHPNDLKKDYTETLLLFVSFIKYIELMTKLIDMFQNI
ncbi:MULTISPECIES: hypothetical protein [Bacillus cereus group]|uniref:Uncharacterized protein n=1 Tax=Bacillus cereus TaxID=1396 RepID=A0ABD7DMW2_BACCE|nr:MULTISPECIES: hypothetical protein [Bacillus cereus group]QRY18162.1 hypothetical protein JTF64_13180 [Bacillus cereus]